MTLILVFLALYPSGAMLYFMTNLFTPVFETELKLENAKAYKFKHNNIRDLQSKYDVEIRRRAMESGDIAKLSGGVTYVITESIFFDGR